MSKSFKSFLTLPKPEVRALAYSLPTIPRKADLVIGQKARVEYQIEVMEKGRVVYTHPKKTNLILNIGLDAVATNSWLGNLVYISVGSNVVPVKRDSGATTFTRVGNTVTANNAFFDPTDDDAGGRLLKFDSGEEMTVTAYISALTVTVSVSGTLASSQGTLWYVNETVNTGEFMRFNSVESQTEAFSVDTLAHTVRMLSNPATGSNVAREIGWSSVGTANGVLFGRDLVSGGGVSIGTGQQYRVTLTLYVTYSPASPVSYADVGTNGFNTAGQGCFGPIKDGVQSWSFNSGTLRALDPSTPAPIGMYLVDFTLPSLSFTNPTLPGPGRFDTVGMSFSSYTSGSYFRDASGGFGVNSVNGTLYGFALGDNNSGFAGASPNYNYKFTTPQTKDNLHNLVFTIRKSWQRVLVN